MGAFERAIAAYGTGAYDDATIEFLFPEVKESEGEWIMKHIIEILERLSPCHWDGNEKSRCIAYLEKKKWAQPGDEDRYMEGYMNGMNDALKEQKPAEWSEEDKNRHYYLCKLLRETWDKVDKGCCIDDAITWFEKLPGRIFRSYWKPSEEQMEAFKESLMSVAYTENKIILESLYEQLKNL